MEEYKRAPVYGKRRLVSSGMGGSWGPVVSLRPGRIGYLKKRRKWKRRMFPRPFFYLSPPAKITMRMKGTVQLTLTGGASTESHYVKLNSCFDPFGDISAIQTPWFDKMASMYNYYMVTSAAFSVHTVERRTDDSVRYCIYPSRASAVATTFANATGQIHAKNAVLHKEPRNEPSGIRVFTTFSRLDGSPLDESQDAALVTADPTHLMYGYILFAKVLAGNLSSDEFNVSVEQNVVFFGRVSPMD